MSNTQNYLNDGNDLLHVPEQRIHAPVEHVQSFKSDVSQRFQLNMTFGAIYGSSIYKTHITLSKAQRYLKTYKYFDGHEDMQKKKDALACKIIEVCAMLKPSSVDLKQILRLLLVRTETGIEFSSFFQTLNVQDLGMTVDEFNQFLSLDGSSLIYYHDYGKKASFEPDELLDHVHVRPIGDTTGSKSPYVTRFEKRVADTIFYTGNHNFSLVSQCAGPGIILMKHVNQRSTIEHYNGYDEKVMVKLLWRGVTVMLPNWFIDFMNSALTSIVWMNTKRYGRSLPLRLPLSEITRGLKRIQNLQSRTICVALFAEVMRVIVSGNIHEEFDRTKFSHFKTWSEIWDDSRDKPNTLYSAMTDQVMYRAVFMHTYTRLNLGWRMVILAMSLRQPIPIMWKVIRDGELFAAPEGYRYVSFLPSSNRVNVCKDVFSTSFIRQAFSISESHLKKIQEVNVLSNVDQVARAKRDEGSQYRRPSNRGMPKPSQYHDGRLNRSTRNKSHDDLDRNKTVMRPFHSECIKKNEYHASRVEPDGFDLSEFTSEFVGDAHNDVHEPLDVPTYADKVKVQKKEEIVDEPSKDWEANKTSFPTSWSDAIDDEF